MITRSLVDIVHNDQGRLGRAVRLVEEWGEGIEQVDDERYLVPSSDGSGVYAVRYGGEIEECSCLDHEFHPEESCKHLLAVAIRHARRRRSFHCEGCGDRFPTSAMFTVPDETFFGYFEGDPLCEECAIRGGVL